MDRLSLLQYFQASDYSPNKLKRCLEAVENKELSLRKASKLYNIPRTTIWEKIHGIRPKEKCRKGPEARLGLENEKKIEEWAIDMARRGFPITKSGFLHTVTNIVKELPIDMREKLGFKDDVPGRGWFYSFLKRHDNIRLRRGEYLSWPRANVTEMKIRKWFEETEKLLKDNNIFAALQDPSRIFNGDESALWLNAKDGYYLGEKGKSLSVICKNNDKSNLSVCFMIAADGSYVPPMGLFKGKRLQSQSTLLLPSDWGVGISESGWMTSESFYEYIANVFVPYLEKKHIARPVIIFMDGHRSHLSLPLSYFCRDNGIVLVCLPPAATHIMQPLDVAYFRGLKMYWRSHLQEMKRCSNKEITKYEVLSNLKIVLDNHASKLENSARNGFRRCGLYPWSADNADYSKCHFFEEVETPNVPETQSHRKTAISMLEDKICVAYPTLLAEFRKADIAKTEWSGKLESTNLFHIWQLMHHDEDAFNFIVMGNSTCRNEPGLFVETRTTDPVISNEDDYYFELDPDNPLPINEPVNAQLDDYHFELDPDDPLPINEPVNAQLDDYHFELDPDDPLPINEPVNAQLDHDYCPVTVESESKNRCPEIILDDEVPVMFGDQTVAWEEEVVSVPVEDISSMPIEDDVLSMSIEEISSIPVEETMVPSVPVQDTSQNSCISTLSSPEEVKKQSRQQCVRF